MKKLGFGLMRLPILDKTDVGSVDIEQFKKMVDIFIEKGFTYFDTAFMYCGFKSETAVKTALVERYPRDSFTLASKLHWSFINSEDDRDKVFDAQLEKTGAGFFDYYLLHGVEANSYENYKKYDCFNWLKSKKEQGLIKHIGFSFHDNAELLDMILTEHPDMEFVQLQINYLDWESKWVQSRACYDIAVKHNKPVIIMEPIKGGTLAKLPEKAENLFRGYAPDRSASLWALGFCASLENVMVVLSGMSNIEQIKENTDYFDSFTPFNNDEINLTKKAAEIICSDIAVPCTGCAYCVDGCPRSIAIPQYFSLYNEDMREAEDKHWTANMLQYDNLAKNFGKASECIECRKCEKVCPQHLPVTKHLKAVSKYFEKK